jgi:tRNA threonylcarbamoyl adenosine modification protein YeaZ
MLLAFDTSTSACTAALFDSDGRCVARADEVIGRGHAERLVPMIAELLDGRSADSVLVGTGPGSFTGIRVGIAAAHGLAIGWGATSAGMSSLALLAASVKRDDEVAAAMLGGHGELFVQQFGGGLIPVTELLNLAPQDAALAISAETIVGPGAALLVETRGHGTAIQAWPSAADALALPAPLRALSAAPVYARPPDAKVRNAA